MALTVIYAWSGGAYSGGTTPPTAAQMNQPGGVSTLITATINMLDADTTGTITHNFGHSSLGVSNQWPLIGWYFTTAGTAWPELTFNPSASNPGNALTVGKVSGSGTGFTANIWLMRPHTLIE